MSKPIEIAYTPDIPRERWLGLRRAGIGGSDAAAILGLNEYSSPYSVWMDKLGTLPEREETEAMRQGIAFEGYVAQRFTEATGKRVRRRNNMLQSAEYPFMLANIDREVIGEKAGLECKTTSVMNLKKFKDGEYPANYYVQCCHYLAVTGWKRWYLAVLVLNQGFYHFVIDRDEAEIAALVQAESDFWKLVQDQTPPPVDGSRATANALDAVSGEAERVELQLPHMVSDFDRYYALRDSIKTLAKEAETIRQRIKAEMGGLGEAYSGDYRAVWSANTRASISKPALLKHCPKKIIAKAIKPVTYRNFRIDKMEAQS